jgi:DNA-binding response OmpR family regulator
LGARILIVEDEQIIAEDLAVQVGRIGFEVLGLAISGEDAIEMARQTRPEVVLMDIQLEGKMTGMEAARIIRDATGAEIVFVTAFPSVLHESSQAGERGVCLNKPFSQAQLQGALVAALRSRSTGEHSS